MIAAYEALQARCAAQGWSLERCGETGWYQLDFGCGLLGYLPTLGDVAEEIESQLWLERGTLREQRDQPGEVAA